MSDTLGRKYDTGKLRWSLLPIQAVQAILEVLEYGAKKYTITNPDGTVDDGANNWSKVAAPKTRYWDAAMRHLAASRLGEVYDPIDTGPDTPPGSGLSHLAHAGCCVLFLLAKEIEEKDLSEKQTSEKDLSEKQTSQKKHSRKHTRKQKRH